MQVRRPQFNLTGAPRFWNGGSPVRTHLLNAISVLLPHGEKFFIETATLAIADLDDPVLRKQCAGFIAQENVHSNQHRRYNQEISNAGYNIAALEDNVANQLKTTTRWLPLKWKLAIVAAYEHLTALLGYRVLTDEEWLKDAHPGFADLWRWHSVEEIEHKSAAFDLYYNAGGNYFVRIMAMLIASLGFAINIFWMTTYFAIKDRSLFTLSYWWDWFSFTFWKSGYFGGLAVIYFSYFSPWFHPDNRNDGDIILGWEQENA